MATTAKAYRNPEDYESEKTASPFTRIAQVRASTLAERHRNLIVAMLYKNRFGDELWMSTESVSVVMGRVCYRRKTAETDTRGRRLGSCERISRRAVQRLIDEVVTLGILTQVYDANRRVPYGGGEKFRHTATYRLNPDKLVPRKTHEQYVEERDRGRAANRAAHRAEVHRDETHREQAEVTPIRKPAQPAPSPLPPAPAAPLPRKTAVEEEPKRARLTRGEVKALSSYFKGAANKKREQKKYLAQRAIPVAPPAPRPEIDPWLRILRVLETKIQRHSFDTWLKPTRYSGESGLVLYVQVPTEEFRYGGEKYADLIQEAIDNLGLGFNDVRFITDQQFIPPASTILTEAEVAECVEKACRLLSTSTRRVSVEDATVALRVAGVL
jgi:hypothetical protein